MRRVVGAQCVAERQDQPAHAHIAAAHAQVFAEEEAGDFGRDPGRGEAPGPHRPEASAAAVGYAVDHGIAAAGQDDDAVFVLLRAGEALAEAEAFNLNGGYRREAASAGSFKPSLAGRLPP